LGLTSFVTVENLPGHVDPMLQIWTGGLSDFKPVQIFRQVGLWAGSFVTVKNLPGHVDPMLQIWTGGLSDFQPA
jgi:hypothetical protein